jgi:hypothetical protein
MNKPAFYLIVCDDDKNQFTVEGPMFDDKPWNTAVVRAQRDGRNVRCCNGGRSRSDAIAEWRQHYGHHFVESGTIVWPPQSK